MKNESKLSFEELALKAIKGDGAKELVVKIKRKAVSALEAQIALQNSNLVDLEDKLSEAEERKALSVVNNGKAIENNKEYVQGIIDAASAQIEAENDLAECKATIALLQETLESINGSAEVTDEVK